MDVPSGGNLDASFERFEKAKRAFLGSGRALSLFEAIVLAASPSDALGRLAEEDPDVEGVVADYYESFKASVDE